MNEMNDAHAYEMQMQLWKPNTWDVTVNISIGYEEEYHKHKEAKKKKNVSSGSFDGNQKCQKTIYHPVNHSRPSFHPP
jgi:hypothetical protein